MQTIVIMDDLESFKNMFFKEVTQDEINEIDELEEILSVPVYLEE
jgi:hypothetical protein